MTRRRIGLLVTLALGILLASVGSDAQPSTAAARVGFLSLSPPAYDSPFFELFRQTLREFGYIEGQNVHLEYRWAYWKAEQLPELAAELVRRHMDVIVAWDSPAIDAAQHSTRTIPIVVISVVDPETLGLVERLSRPGGNITGVSGMVPELNGKRLELLTAVVPQGSPVAVLWDPRIGAAAGWLDEVKRAAHALGVELLSLEVYGPHGFERAFDAAIEGSAGALLMLPALLFTINEQHLAALALQNHLPAMYWDRGFAKAGGLMAYGPHLPDLWRRAAVLTGKILQGAKPADLPVEQPMKFELVINLKTAQALGLTIPPTLLFQADEVIR
jgi:putative tryptophan/tyrosine transport system substrate-binding protein